MSIVLVTGGTGHLWRALIPELQRAGHHERALTRRPRQDTDVKWVVGDLVTDEGLDEALAGVDVVLNAAINSPMAQRGGVRLTDFFRTLSDVEVQGIRRLIECAIGGSRVAASKEAPLKRRTTSLRPLRDLSATSLRARCSVMAVWVGSARSRWQRD